MYQVGPGLQVLVVSLVSHSVEHSVLHEDADCSAHEGGEEVDVDVVPGAVETPGEGGTQRHGDRNEEQKRTEEKREKERDLHASKYSPPTSPPFLVHGPLPETTREQEASLVQG